MHGCWGEWACTAGRRCCQRRGPLCTHIAPTCLPACPPTWLATCREFPGTFAITPEDGEAYNAYNDSYARRQGVDAVPKPFTWM
jgi:hypothetical protein